MSSDASAWPAPAKLNLFLHIVGRRADGYHAIESVFQLLDFGDSVRRHPAQLYEIVWLALLALWIYRLSQRAHRNGDLFKTFMAGYFVFRLAVDFIKPSGTLGGLTSVQMTSPT